MSNPLWINADGGQPEYTAQSLRLSMSGLLTKGVADRLGARPGVIPNGRDAVSLSGVQVTVHDCNAVLNPGLSSQDGPYIAHFTEHAHTLDPGDGSSPRIDIVVARVYDDDHDGSGQREAVTEYITGTPGVSPEPPATPAGALRIATIAVPADGTGSPSLTYVAPSTVAAGGVLPVRSAAELPTSGRHAGMVAYRADVDQLDVWDGSDWSSFYRGGWVQIDSGSFSGTPPFTIDITQGGRFPAGTFSCIRFRGRGNTATASWVTLRVNGDTTASMHESAWIRRQAGDGSVDTSGRDSTSIWRLGSFGSFPGSSVFETTIMNTQVSNRLGFQSRGSSLGSTAAVSFTSETWGSLTESRLLDSLRISTFDPNSDFMNLDWQVEGLIA